MNTLIYIISICGCLASFGMSMDSAMLDSARLVVIRKIGGSYAMVPQSIELSSANKIEGSIHYEIAVRLKEGRQEELQWGNAHIIKLHIEDADKSFKSNYGAVLLSSAMEQIQKIHNEATIIVDNSIGDVLLHTLKKIGFKEEYYQGTECKNFYKCTPYSSIPIYVLYNKPDRAIPEIILKGGNFTKRENIGCVSQTIVLLDGMTKEEMSSVEYMQAVAFEPGSVALQWGNARIIDVDTHAEFREQGYATLLLSRAIQSIKGKNASAKICASCSRNNVIAQKLFNKAGFSGSVDQLDINYLYDCSSTITSNDSQTKKRRI